MYCLPGYVSATEELPPNRVNVLVSCLNWNAPRVCWFDENFNGPGRPAFCESSTGRWAWYPERMCWQSIDEGEPAPKPANDDHYFALEAA